MDCDDFIITFTLSSQVVTTMDDSTIVIEVTKVHLLDHEAILVKQNDGRINITLSIPAETKPVIFQISWHVHNFVFGYVELLS